MSRGEPQGRFVMRQKGHGVSAKRFHLYNDCGTLWGSSGEGSEFEIIDVNDRDIDLLGLAVCKPCERRSNEVSALDTIADAVEFLVIEGVDGDIRSLSSGSADLIAAEAIKALEKQGYDIVRRRKP